MKAIIGKALRLIGNVCLGLLVKRGSTQAMPEYEHVKANMNVKESHAQAREKRRMNTVRRCRRDLQSSVSSIKRHEYHKQNS